MCGGDGKLLGDPTDQHQSCSMYSMTPWLYLAVGGGHGDGTFTVDNSDWLKTSIETFPGKHDNKDCWIIKATYVANRFENG